MTQTGLISSCARAATAQEAAFRIDYPLAAARNTRVVALDDTADQIVHRTSQMQWAQARFYSTIDPGHNLLTMSGETVPLTEQLKDSNSLVLVSTNGENAEAAATIGAACRVRGIMTAGLVVTPGRLTSEALLALRPHARILLVPAEEDDLV
ncbi:3-methyl-2-oxobutanoate hydroxymethyltransferase, partial [Streptomyces sp. NPDC046900]|uniref:3-methyl-2-oxobutanoate hydroxymethyltransferase n=1 Tax=Streptomyces sp. NPDC046900 TaxID=3155473 RepID=UPI0033CACED5